MDKKMNLGSKGTADIGKVNPASYMGNSQVQVVQPRPKGMGTHVAKEAIQGCCGHSPVKAAGKKS